MRERIKKVLRLIWLRATCLLPTRVPTTYDGYNSWLADIVYLTGTLADRDSLEWVISNEVMRQPTGRDRIPKMTFVKLLRKYAANQFAANKVQEIKEKQAKQQAEATARAQQEKAAAADAQTKETTN